MCNASRFSLVPSVTYFSTLEKDAIRFSETSVNFLIQGYTSQKTEHLSLFQPLDFEVHVNINKNSS
jgi:hypothetical protein